MMHSDQKCLEAISQAVAEERVRYAMLLRAARAAAAAFSRHPGFHEERHHAMTLLWEAIRKAEEDA